MLLFNLVLIKIISIIHMYKMAKKIKLNKKTYNIGTINKETIWLRSLCMQKV